MNVSFSFFQTSIQQFVRPCLEEMQHNDLEPRVAGTLASSIS